MWKKDPSGDLDRKQLTPDARPRIPTVPVRGSTAIPIALSQALRSGLLALAVGLGAISSPACGGKQTAKAWRRIEIEAPSTPLDTAAWEVALGCDVTAADTGLHLRWHLKPDVWNALPGGVFSTDRPLPAQLSGVPQTRLELRSEKHTFSRVVGAKEKPQPGNFHSEGKKLYIRLHDEGAEIPPLTFSAFLPRGRREGPGWRVSNGSVSGPAVPVLPGERWSVAMNLPPGMALRFFATASGQGEADKATVTFRVALNGETIWEQERVAGLHADAWHTVPLDSVLRTQLSTIELSVDGDPAWTAFVAPALGPGAPTPSQRPSIVLFLADTFRADNLAAYGGDPELTPYLNRLAEEAVLFERAWAPSCWTLPSQGSMFTGALPPQHGALEQGYVLPHSLHTFVEVLARNGYRTGGVTDSGFVSARYNFDQGFEWYLEHKGAHNWSLETTLLRALEFLRANDGRPAFLYVQTYRTHSPYRVGPQESQAEALEFLQVLAAQAPQGDVEAAIHSREAIQGLKRFYLDGVSDLDTKLARWWPQVREVAGFSPGYLVFTSDHGEAFYEHQNRGHRGSMWEELLRVPLFILGEDLTARRQTQAASLVDLSRTLVSLAGIPPLPQWQGEDLLALDGDRPVHGFYRTKKRYEWVAIEGARKLFGDPQQSGRAPLGAFDLGADPGEKTDLAHELAWPLEMAHRFSPEIQLLMREAPPGMRLAEDALTDDVLEMLRSIGYAGD